MEHFTKWILKNKKVIILSIILIDLLSLFMVITHFSISTDLIFSFAKGMKFSSQFNNVATKYNSVGTFIVAIEQKNITSKSNLIKIYDYEQEIRDINGIYYVRSFLPDKFLNSLVFTEVNPNTIKNNYKTILSFMEKINSDMFKNDSGLIFVSVKNNSNIIKIIDSLLNITKKYGYNVHLSGNKVMSYYLFKYLIFIILFLIPLVIIVLIVVFNFAIGNLKAALFSLLPAGMAALWTFGFIFWASGSLSIITVIVPMFVIIMGSADGLHITSHFIHVSSSIKNKSEAVISTMKMVGLSVILTTITTILGFFSLTMTNLDFLREMGLYTSVSIAFAGIISWTFLPIILSETEIGKIRSKRINKSYLINFFIMATKKKKTVIFSLIIIIIFFALFIPLLEIQSSRADLFKSYTKVVKDINFFNNQYGFSNIDFIDYKTQGSDIFDSNIKKKILNFEKELIKIKGVKKVTSFMDVQNVIKKDINNPFMEKFVIQRMINQNIFPLTQWVYKNKDYKILIQLSSSNPSTIKSIEELALKEKSAIFTGPDFVFYKLNQIVVRVQVESLLAAVGMVFILMIAIYRSFVVAFKSIIPILYTLVLFFGFLRLSGFNLNIVVADVASIAIGIGIDYSIHFMGAYDYFNRDLKQTIESVGVPIIANALGLSLGLSVLLLSPLKVHLYVSLSIAFTMFVSSLATMLILPMILKSNNSD